MAKKKVTEPKEKNPRKFEFNGVKLEDPDPNMSNEEVRDFYSTHYPELASAGIKGPFQSNGVDVWTFQIKTGTKG